MINEKSQTRKMNTGLLLQFLEKHIEKGRGTTHILDQNLKLVKSGKDKTFPRKD